MGDIVERSVTKRTLDLIEAFDAPHVEGPIRLFDEQCLRVRLPAPVVLAAGADTTTPAGHILLSNDGIGFQDFLVPGADGFSVVGRVGGFRALAGGFDGSVWRNCNSAFMLWERLLFDITGLGRDCSDIEYNQRTNRTLLVFGDLANQGGANLYKTDDNGQTFEEIILPATLQGGIRSLKFNPVTDTWFGVGRRNGATHIIRSLDDGDTWESIPDGVLAAQAWLDVAVNTTTGAVLAMPDGQFVHYSLDNGDTWTPGDLSGRLFNTGFSEDLQRFCTETSGNDFAYSDDDGATWTVVAFPFGFDHDISDITWMDNVEAREFLAVGRSSGSLDGFAATSPDAITWTLRFQDADVGFSIASPLSPVLPPLQWRMTLPVTRLEQIQHWRIENPAAVVPGDNERAIPTITQEERDKFRGLGVRDADRDWQLTENAGDIAHTDEPQDDDPIPSPWFHARWRSCRIEGGYLQFHGQVGKVSRVYPFLNELEAVCVVNNIAAPTSWPLPVLAGTMQVNP